MANDCKMEMDYSLGWAVAGVPSPLLGVLKGREVRKIGRMKAVPKSFHSRNFPARLGVKNG